MLGSVNNKLELLGLISWTAKRNINNLRYGDNTNLMAEREEEL